MVASQRNRVHLLLVIGDGDQRQRFFAACAPHLSVANCASKRLTPHVDLVTCPKCHRQIHLVRRSMNKS